MIGELKPYPTYKDSGTPLLNQVPATWEVIPFSRLASQKVVLGQTERQLLSVYLNRGVVRFVDVAEKRTNSTSEDLSQYQAVDPGDLVLNNQQAWRGSVGVSAHSGIISPAYFVLRLSPQLLPNYANLLFRERFMVSQFVVCSKGVGTIQRNLYWPHLKRTSVIVPPHAEQAAIVKFLAWANGRLERAIRAKRRVIALLNEQKQAIIYRAVVRGLDQAAPLKDSGLTWLGKIPRHWELIPAKHLFRSVTRRAIRADDTKMSVTQKYGLVATADMKENSTQASSFDRFQLCHPGDLVLNKYKAHLGVFWAATARGLITPNYTVFKPNRHLSTNYFEHLFHTRAYRDAFSMIVYGVIDGMCPLYTQDFYRTPCVCPPYEDQIRISNALLEMTKAEDLTISRLEREIEYLHEYRTRLTSDVVSGKLDVREVSARLPGEAELDVGEGPVDETDDAELTNEEAEA